MSGSASVSNTITRALVQANATTYFVFGDNLVGRGLGGSAKQMRGEPNTIGIPTKKYPNNNLTSFFCDNDWNNPKIKNLILERFFQIIDVLEKDYNVVFAGNIGSGLANLPQCAPEMYKTISGYIQEILLEYP